MRANGKPEFWHHQTKEAKIHLSDDATITQLVCFSSLFHTSSTHACTHHRRGKKQQRETGNTPREYPQAKCLLQRQFRGQSLQRTAKMPSSRTTKMEKQIRCPVSLQHWIWLNAVRRTSHRVRGKQPRGLSNRGGHALQAGCQGGSEGGRQKHSSLPRCLCTSSQLTITN